jgi:hypothetical protein
LSKRTAGDADRHGKRKRNGICRFHALGPSFSIRSERNRLASGLPHGEPELVECEFRKSARTQPIDSPRFLRATQAEKGSGIVGDQRPELISNRLLN